MPLARELRDIAKELGLRGYSKMNKTQLTEAIEGHVQHSKATVQKTKSEPTEPEPEPTKPAPKHIRKQCQRKMITLSGKRIEAPRRKRLLPKNKIFI